MRAHTLPFGLTDQVDSVIVVTDGTGQVETRTEYMPYGETWFQEGDETNEPKYNSQEYDKETGYYYYNARHYDPGIGRFVTADNVVDGEYSTQGWNRYMYCHGNPVMYMDPTGHGLAEWGANLTRKIENYVNGTNYALPYPEVAKKSVENQMQGARESGTNRGRTNSSNNPVNEQFISPIKGVAISDLRYSSSQSRSRPNPFNNAQTEFHPGTDISAPENSEVVAMKSGKIRRINTDSRANDYGIFAEIEHPDGSITRYNHLSRQSITRLEELGNNQNRTIRQGVISPQKMYQL